jgi:hypothetical protein
VRVSKKKKQWLIFTGCILAIFLTVVIRYGNNLDPTEQVFTVRLQNDSGQPVLVGLCDNTLCSRVSEVEKLEPGHDIPLAASDEGVFDEYRVDAKGHTLGCVPLLFYNRDLTQLNLMSSIRPCRPSPP